MTQFTNIKADTSTLPRRINLSPAYTTSSIIIGFWQLAGGHGPVDKQSIIADMERFAEAGFTSFDCADIYTGVEELIGNFIGQHRSRFFSGELPSVQIHTKYVPDLDALPGLKKEYTATVINRSLKRLQVEILDLVQFHWWDYSIPGYVETARHLADLKKEGKIREIGVTNFDAEHLREILEAGVPVVSNQVQYSLLDSRPETDLNQLCLKYGMQLLCYGTLAGGFLTDRYLGKEWRADKLENRSLIKYGKIIDEFGGPELFQKLMHTLEQISDRHGLNISDLAINYILNKPAVAAVIIGATSSRHLSSLLNLNQVQLSDQDLEEIAAVISQATGPEGPVFGLERDRNGIHGRIMKYNLNRVKTNV